MFKEILKQLQNASNPFEGFLGELWTIWTREAARAVLLARWSWQKLAEGLVQQAAAIQRQVQAAQAAGQINDQVNRQLGVMGIFPGFAGGSSFGLGINPDHAMFILFMGTIRAHNGDPPISQGMVQSDTPARGGGLMSWAASKAVAVFIRSWLMACSYQIYDSPKTVPLRYWLLVLGCRRAPVQARSQRLTRHSLVPKSVRP
jgi:hypothetical protein